MFVYTSDADKASDDSLIVGAERLVGLAAGNPDANAEILEALSSSDSPYVRSQVAQNAHTPSLVLDKLMHDCKEVRIALARNPKAIERVWSLVNDDSAEVRLALAKNPDLPDHVYQVLQQDANKQVARRARRTLGQLRQDDNLVTNLFRVLTKAS